MSILSRILILVCVFLVVFVGLDRLTPIVYWALFFVMGGCVYMLWRSMYWIKKKDMVDLGEKGWSLFCAKVNDNQAEDLSRGRLVADGENLKFYRKADEKKDKDLIRSSTKKAYVLVWKTSIATIESVEFKKIVSIRKGFELDCNGHKARFVCQFATAYKDELLRSCGF